MAARKSITERFEDKVTRIPESGCWIWMARINACGYGTLKVDKRSTLAHRISHELFIGPIPSGLCVLHDCDIPACVNPDHLKAGDMMENTHDMIRKGRDWRGIPKLGEAHATAKLTEEKVQNIRANPLKLKQRELAEMYGVTQSTIWAIRVRKTWAHI